MPFSRHIVTLSPCYSSFPCLYRGLQYTYHSTLIHFIGRGEQNSGLGIWLLAIRRYRAGGNSKIHFFGWGWDKGAYLCFVISFLLQVDSEGDWLECVYCICMKVKQHLLLLMVGFWFDVLLLLLLESDSRGYFVVFNSWFSGDRWNAGGRWSWLKVSVWYFDLADVKSSGFFSSFSVQVVSFGG